MVRRCGEKALLLSVGVAQENAAGIVVLDSPDMPEDRAGIVPGRSTREAIFRVGTMVQKVREAPQALHAPEDQHEGQVGGGTPTEDSALSQKPAQGHAADCRCRGGSEGATASDKGEVESRPARDPVFGRFQLSERFNADQVGLAFANGLETTYDVAGTKRVHNSQPLTGLEKRQCTVNICIGAGDKLIRPAISFREKGI